MTDTDREAVAAFVHQALADADTLVAAGARDVADGAAATREGAEIRRILQGPALQAAIAARLQQVVRHGHDAEADAMLALDALPLRAREYLAAALEQIRGHHTERNLPVARKNLARTAALCLAAYDRLEGVA